MSPRYNNTFMHSPLRKSASMIANVGGRKCNGIFLKGSLVSRLLSFFFSLFSSYWQNFTLKKIYLPLCYHIFTMFSLIQLLIYISELTCVLAELTTRSSSTLNTSTEYPIVDLGYGFYQGYYNATSGLNRTHYSRSPGSVMQPLPPENCDGRNHSHLL
jgi:hypothetical protein